MMADGDDSNRLAIVAASPSPLKRPEAPLYRQSEPQSRTNLSNNAFDDSTSTNDLAAVHGQALQSFLRLNNAVAKDVKSKKLVSLQQKRISLASQVEEARQKEASGRTVGDELREKKRRAEMLEDRPYLNVWKKKSQTSSQPVELSVRKVLEEQDIALRMQQIRHYRKIAAAYRLGGISMFPCPDEEVLALRFDVEVEGIFVAFYHCFFDLVLYDPNGGEEEEEDRNDAEDLLRIRLIQHTLPAPVPLASILEKTMGDTMCIGPYGDDSKWNTGGLKHRLRKCASEIYQACYCYCVRKQAAALLKSIVAGNEHTPAPYIIEELECSNKLDKVSFQLKGPAGIAALHVSLIYKDPMRVQPTSVSVKNLMATTSRPRVRNPSYAAAEISDTDDEDNGDVREELIDNAIVSFRRLPIQKALDEVSEAMSEW